MKKPIFIFLYCLAVIAAGLLSLAEYSGVSPAIRHWSGIIAISLIVIVLAILVTALFAKKKPDTENTKFFKGYTEKELRDKLARTCAEAGMNGVLIAHRVTADIALCSVIRTGRTFVFNFAIEDRSGPKITITV